MKRYIAILFLLLLTITARAEEVTVEGEAVSEPQGAHPSATVTVINTTGSTERVRDIGQAIEESAGVTVRRFGGLGDFSLIMVRGTSPSQVGIYLDGIPLSGASHSIVNLATLPLDPLSRIEVYRGAAPLDLGSNIGGAINLVTRRDAGGWMAGASQSYGSFDTYKSDLFGSGTFGNFGGLIFYNHMQSEGDFKFLDDNGTPFNESDDVTVRRRNNDFTSDDVLAKFSWRPMTGFEVFAGDEFFNKEAGVPGIGAFQADEARLATLRNTLHIGAKYFHGIYTIKALTYHTYTNEEFKDPLGEIGVGAQKMRYLTNSFGGNVLGKVFITRWAMASLFLEGRGEIFEPDDLLSHIDGPESNRVTLTAAAQGELLFFKDRLIIVPTVRVENYRNHFSGSGSAGSGLPSEESDRQDTFVSPHLGMRVAPWKIIEFHANAGLYYRQPTFLELFGDRGSVVGNPDLKVESGFHTDGGVALSLKERGRLDKLSLSYTYFYIHVTDLIVLNQNSQRTVRAENIGEAEIAGQEVSLDGQAFGHVKATAAYTYQQAVDRSEIDYLRGKSLPGRPRNELHLGMTLFQPRWGQLFYRLDYLDGNYLDRTNMLEVPARTIHNAGVTVTPLKGLALTFEALNIGDEEASDVLGYPLPGRSYFSTVSYRFSHKPRVTADNGSENSFEEGVAQ